MDRDKRWDRIERGYDAIVHGEGSRAASAHAAIEAALRARRERRVRPPTVIDGVDGTVRDGDAVVHANFRADRARQLTHALADDGVRRVRPDVADRSPGAAGPVRRDDDRVRGGPAGPGRVPAGDRADRSREAFSEAGWRQFHVAETEKYAHVTYFFNGGVEAPWPGRGPRADPEPQGRDVRPRSRR